LVQVVLVVLAVHQIPALLALTPYFHLLPLAAVAQAVQPVVLAEMARQLMVMAVAGAVLGHLVVLAELVTGLEKMAAQALLAQIPAAVAAAVQAQMVPQEVPAILEEMAETDRLLLFLARPLLTQAAAVVVDLLRQP
jgi:hypothetical protein